ncbi:hypothetical protein BDF21DRAFT_402698 [Thamnidium elegans]|nr:hypothetical protein BDF21DRAFT_402698 [Thamnidium elegans]
MFKDSISEIINDEANKLVQYVNEASKDVCSTFEPETGKWKTKNKLESIGLLALNLASYEVSLPGADEENAKGIANKVRCERKDFHAGDVSPETKPAPELTVYIT